MTRYIELARSEFVHLVRSPFKTISLALFGLAVIYGCQNGYGLFKAHKEQIMAIKTDNERSGARHAITAGNRCLRPAGLRVRN